MKLFRFFHILILTFGQLPKFSIKFKNKKKIPMLVLLKYNKLI